MLKYIMLQKKRTALNAKIKALRAQRKKLADQEKKLQRDVEGSEDISEELEEQINELTDQQTALDDQIAEVLDELDTIQEQLDAIEDATDAEPSASEDEDAERSAEPAPSLRSRQARGISGAAVETGAFRCRSRCFATRAQRDAFYACDDMKTFLQRVRALGGTSRRAVTGAELSIPTVILEVLRDRMDQYSKLITKVRLQPVKGKARQNVIGEVPAGVWTEMAGALNELTFVISEVEADGYKVGGYIPIDNYLLADSDIALGEEILYMLGQAIGLALDQAIVYGTGTKMPIGIVTRLAEAEQPAYWGENRAPWVDVHTTNVQKLSLAAKLGAEFFVPLLGALKKAKTKYTNGERVWLMNQETKDDLLIKAMGFDSAAAIVAGMNNTMPILGGEIITLEFIPNNNIIGGALGDYLLVEREGSSFAYSDIPMFLQDKTVFKGTARYDGQPIHGEDFVAVSYDNTAVVTTLPGGFAPDTANT